MDSLIFAQHYFETDAWLWPILAIISLGAFWIYHRRLVYEMNIQRRELMENEHWLNEAQHIGNIGSWYRYLNGDKVRWSPQLYRIYGVSEKITPSYAVFLNVVHPDDRVEIKKSFDQIHKSGETTVLNYRIKKDDDSVFYVENCVKGSFNSDGELVAVYGSVHDVTEHRIDEKKLKRALKEAESSNRAKGAFLSSVSHEIRTPLNAVIGFSAIMAEKELTAAQYKSYGESVNAAGKSLSALINDILDLSALESLSFTMHPLDVNVDQIMDEVSSVFKLITSGKGIELVMQRPDELPIVNMDGKRLRQILINIIGNAVKFTKEGRVAVDLKVVYSSAVKHECDLIFKISDTGVGINRIDQSRIFREFEQESGETNRRFGGSGLGLSIVTQLLELMGGTIHLQSEVGVGSIFTVTFLNLPVVDDKDNSGVVVDETEDGDSKGVNSSIDAAVLSAGDAALNNTGRELVALSDDALDKLKAAFGTRFAQLAKGVNIERVNSLAGDLHIWSESRSETELKEFSAMFSDMTASMKIVELIKIATLLASE